jgi:TonB family protein
VFLLAAVSVVWSAAPARAQTAHRHCATQSPRVAKAAPFTLPESDALLNTDVVFTIDIGSDGRVRGVEMLKGSGDATADAAARDAVMKSTYRPAETKCVAYSNAFTESFRIGPEASPSPLQP